MNHLNNMKKQIKSYKIQGNPNNPRIIKNDKYRKLVQSIKDFPEMLKLRPIVVDENMMILGGNMRWKASRDAGLKDVWIDIAEGLTDEKKEEFIVKDNVNFGEWDWDMVANQWETGKLKEWGVDLPVLDERLEVINGEEPEIEITEEILEEHNYIVFTFDNKLDWQVVKDIFDIKTVYKLNKKMERKGVGRVRKGTELIEKLKR
tara:strand:+ start:232 stop:843 length:612 start_codon:yes stop_codon:yes gene_type:complete